jgi:hypothetical protein
VIGGSSGITGGSHISPGDFIGLFTGNSSSNEIDVQNIFPTSGTFGNFFAYVNAAPGGTNSWVFTVRKNGANQAVTCTVSGSNQSCSDLTHTTTFAQGDVITIQVTTPNHPAVASAQWTATYKP